MYLYFYNTIILVISSKNNEHVSINPLLYGKHYIIDALEFENIIRKRFLEERDVYGSFNVCIEKYVDKDAITTLVDVLNTCKCCDRHQLDRPVKYEPWRETTISGTQDIHCECHCRHFSRFICRTCE